MTRSEEIIWLAGLLEGEGSFFLDCSRAKWRPGLRVSVKMTDSDIIERAAAVFPSKGKIGMYTDSRSERFSDLFEKKWNGADAEKVMLAVLPYMGERRAAKIRECLKTPNLSHRKAIA